MKFKLTKCPIETNSQSKTAIKLMHLIKNSSKRSKHLHHPILLTFRPWGGLKMTAEEFLHLLHHVNTDMTKRLDESHL